MKIYLQYTQEELDRQYEHRNFVTDAEDYIAAQRTESERVRASATGRFDLPYGAHQDELLDLYLPDRVQGKDELAPLLVFCHGGAWQRLSKNDSGYISTVYVPEGVALAALNFSLAPEGKLEFIVDQVRRAVVYLYQNAGELQVERDRIFLCGHSSGAHLAANIAVTDWSDFGVPQNLIKGLTLVSGPYDLEPVRLSARNDYLTLDEETARALTPQTPLRPGLALRARGR
mgnify:CR=1 FL=1